jgi:2',3'-cyclic-nucleotide 2'-phosphodiesterase
MRILFIGDIVGRSGRAVLLERLGTLVQDWKLDFVAINGENAAASASRRRSTRNSSMPAST